MFPNLEKTSHFLVSEDLNQVKKLGAFLLKTTSRYVTYTADPAIVGNNL